MRLIRNTISCLFWTLAVQESQAEAVQNGKTNDISKIESNNVIKSTENRRRRLLDRMSSFDYTINDDDGTVTFTVEVAKSNNWISFGTSQNGGMMYGSEVVIGRPALPEGANNPSKYRLGTVMNVKVNGDRLTESQQTLIDPSITSQDGKTILQFTKLLSEPGEIPIDADGKNVFVWAYGVDSSSRFSIHTNSGSTEVDFSLYKGPDSTDNSSSDSTGNLIDESTNLDSTSPDFTDNSSPNSTRPDFTDNSSSDSTLPDFTDNSSPDSTRPPFKVTESVSYRGRWKVHGILAFTAWGVLVPTAISVSLLRNLYPSNFPWLRVHFALNGLACIIMIVVFAIALTSYDTTGRNHFNGTHEKIGLVIFVFVLFQVMGGVFRAHAPKPASAIADTVHDNENVVNEESDEEFTDEGKKVEKSLQRMIWEVMHKGMGVLLLVLGLYEVQSGIALYASRYSPETSVEIAYQAWIGAGLGIVLLLFAYSKLRDRTPKTT
uniref:Cytochrome b561 domain-containing protein n=1 Tax=Ditylum brightwellii TaxID=49249 RepID=A0A7S4S7N1_9STRA